MTDFFKIFLPWVVNETEADILIREFDFFNFVGLLREGDLQLKKKLIVTVNI